MDAISDCRRSVQPDIPLALLRHLRPAFSPDTSDALAQPFGLYAIALLPLKRFQRVIGNLGDAAQLFHCCRLRL